SRYARGTAQRAARPEASKGNSTPTKGPAQTTGSGSGLCARSVRERVSGCNTTRATRPPVSQAPRTWPNSWTACIPSHDAKAVAVISRIWCKRFMAFTPDGRLRGTLRGSGPGQSGERVAAVALQVLKPQPPSRRQHLRVMQNADDFGRLTVVLEALTVAEVVGHDLSIGGIRNEFSVIADFGQYDVRVNPSSEHELFLPDGRAAGDLVLREKLPTAQGTS